MRKVNVCVAFSLLAHYTPTHPQITGVHFLLPPIRYFPRGGSTRVIAFALAAVFSRMC